MNNNLQNELFYFKEQLKDTNNINEVNMLTLTKRKSNWWVSILITGLWQGLNGQVGKMILMWILFFGVGWIWGIIDAHSQQNEFNNQLEFYANKRKKEIRATQETEKNI